MQKQAFMGWLIKRRLFALRYQWSLFKLARAHNAHFEEGVEIRGIDNLRIGCNVTIGARSLLHCGSMAWCDYRGGIEIGDDSYIGPNSVLFGAGHIKIGKQAAIAPNVVIASHQHTFKNNRMPIIDHPIEFAEVVIEDDVWIGAGAIVLPGVNIGQGSVIGAGAVVNRDIPANSVAVGVPAKVIHLRGNSRNPFFKVGTGNQLGSNE